MNATMPLDANPLPLAKRMFRPGMRVAIAVSGGADSVALLRALLAERDRLGLVLSVAHVHHGIRGREADEDAAFTEGLAARSDLPFYLRRVNVPAAADALSESIEEAARNLRYEWFWELIGSGEVDAVATAHTEDDQAETVVHRLIRGAWTDGLGGIHPVLTVKSNKPAPAALRADGSLRNADARGGILRPFLAVRRADIERWLMAIEQPWREDSTNRDDAHTRNRIRHSLLPELAKFNPRIASQLAHLATLARDEEDYWQAELARTLPSLLLPGRAARGGGRSTQPGESTVAIELERLRALHPALSRRVLRAAAGELGVPLSFLETEQLLALCGFYPPKPAIKGIMVGPRLTAQRTPREVRLVRHTAVKDAPLAPTYELAIPGEVAADAFRLRVRSSVGPSFNGEYLQPAIVRGCRSGDKVQMRHSKGPRRIKDIFERLQIAAADRAAWPLIEWQGGIVWMKGVEVESARADAAGLSITVYPIDQPL